MGRDPILDLANAVGGLSVERIAQRGARRIAKVIDGRFASGLVPTASGKLRRSVVVDGASDGILIRSELPYAQKHPELVPPASELQDELRAAFKAELAELPRW